MKTSAIIPALNEAASIGLVIQSLGKQMDAILVVDNGSTDQTAALAAQAGASVVSEPRRGYGRACLKGIASLPKDTEIVLFLDGDFSDHPEEWKQLVAPIEKGEADLVIGSRVRGTREPGALLPVARFGNWLSTSLIALIWGVRFTDLGPFRAIRTSALQGLGMQDTNFGWTVEMQIKAAAQGLRCHEIPVSYRKRIGKSKVSGTISGSIQAGIKILYLIFREALFPSTRPHH
jgi:glycosyltransferase involved in cell wall biosynthesis